MMGFIIDDEDSLHPHQVGHDTLQHLAIRFQRLQLCVKAATRGVPAPKSD